MLTFDDLRGVPTGAVLLAMSLLCWPDTVAQARSRIRGSAGWHLATRGNLRAARSPLFVASVIVGVATAGLGGAIATSALAVTTMLWLRARREARGRNESAAELASGLRLLVAELRAGAHPALAATGAATDAEPGTARLLNGIAAAARLGGDVAPVLHEYAVRRSELRTPLARLARAWALAERHGAALADLLDAVRRDLDQRVRFARDVEAKMAGPRATAGVLAVLPMLGLLLGESVGAAPVRVLTGGAFGQVLLASGAVLVCAGVLWIVRLTGMAVRI